jgi:hypothetical protein
LIRRVWGIFTPPVDNREDRFGRGFIPPPWKRVLKKYSTPLEYWGNSYLNQKRVYLESES